MKNGKSIFWEKMDLSKLNRSNKKECEKDFDKCSRLPKIIKSFELKGKPKDLFDTYSQLYTEELIRLDNHGFRSRFFELNSFCFSERYGTKKGIVNKIISFVNRFEK